MRLVNRGCKYQPRDTDVGNDRGGNVPSLVAWIKNKPCLCGQNPSSGKSSYPCLVRGMVCEVEHPTAGKLTHYGIAPKFSRTPAQVRTPAPLLGQDNAEVYGRWLGY